MKRYIDYLIRSEEHRVDEMLFLQIKDKNDLCYGLMRGDVIEAKPTIYMMATALALYLNSRSRYYKSEKLMEALDFSYSEISTYFMEIESVKALDMDIVAPGYTEVGLKR